MGDKHEAGVEDLTAKVRVLRVGSRQVTLSVVRQLDWVDPASVVPFGRVRTGDDLPGRVRAKSAAPVEIIGTQYGVLVRSVSWRTVLTCGSGEDACPVARAMRAEQLYGSRFPGQLSPEIAHRFATHSAAHDWTRFDPDQRTYEVWAALPLIVLADLG